MKSYKKKVFHPIIIFGETTTTIGLSNQVKQF